MADLQTLENITNVEDMEVLHVGDILIRTISTAVDDLAEGRRIADVLIKKLEQLKGAGLAAPQLGIMKRVFVFQVRKTDLFPDRDETPLYVMINPEIELMPCGTEEEWEGCFSIPGYAGRVPRYSELTMKWLDYEGNRREQFFEGYIARVIQHELDHLDGRVYLDHLPHMMFFATTENYIKMRQSGTLPK